MADEDDPAEEAEPPPPPTEEELLGSSFVVFSSEGPGPGNKREAVLTFKSDQKKWEELPEETFVRIARHSADPGTCISVMIIKHHRISSLPADFDTIGSHMVHLNLSFNRFEQFSLPNAACYVSLDELLLVGNRLRSFDPGAGLPPNLTVLDVSNNCLEELPACITQLKTLKTLNASCNRLSRLCDQVGKMESLVTLELHNNRLVCLPPSFSSLQLECLHLSSNQLQDNSIPVLCHVQTLQELYLAHNLLTFLPCCLRTMTKLKRLVVDGNPITFPPAKHCRQGAAKVREFLQGKYTRSREGCIRGGDVQLCPNPCYESDPERDYQTDSD